MKSLVSLALVSLLVGVGCGDDSSGTGGGASTSASGPGTGGADQGWIVEECGVCFEGKCRGAVDACNADPGCASTYACLAACPADPADGPADEACAAACTAPDSSTAQATYEAVQSCRLTGDGFNGCVTCRGDEPALCEPHPEPTACTACSERECCAQIGAYRNNPEATAMRDCIVEDPACGATFDECVLYCAALHPDGVADFATGIGCSSLRCQGEANCGAPGDEVDPCVTCWNDNCFDERAACDAEPECTLYNSCLGVCFAEAATLEEREACRDQCTSAHPTGEPLSTGFLNCSATRCEAECI